MIPNHADLSCLCLWQSTLQPAICLYTWRANHVPHCLGSYMFMTRLPATRSRLMLPIFPQHSICLWLLPTVQISHCCTFSIYCRCPVAPALQVREEAPEISFNIILSAMDKIKLGLAQRPLEDSPAKRRMSTVEVGRAVAIALTPGMPPIEQVCEFIESLVSRRSSTAVYTCRHTLSRAQQQSLLTALNHKCPDRWPLNSATTQLFANARLRQAPQAESATPM